MNNDESRNNNHPESSSAIISAYAIEKLGNAIVYVISAYMNDNLVGRTQVVNMLEDIIQKIEARRI